MSPYPTAYLILPLGFHTRISNSTSSKLNSFSSPQNCFVYFSITWLMTTPGIQGINSEVVPQPSLILYSYSEFLHILCFHSIFAATDSYYSQHFPDFCYCKSSRPFCFPLHPILPWQKEYFKLVVPLAQGSLNFHN